MEENAFRLYPCHKDGKPLNGFAMTECDANGAIETILGWKKFSNKFGINYYAISIFGSKFQICKLSKFK